MFIVVVSIFSALLLIMLGILSYYRTGQKMKHGNYKKVFKKKNGLTHLFSLRKTQQPTQEITGKEIDPKFHQRKKEMEDIIEEKQNQEVVVEAAIKTEISIEKEETFEKHVASKDLRENK